MTTYSRPVWRQLKNRTIQDIGRALEWDGWIREETRSGIQGYRHPERPPDRNRVVLHIHPKTIKSRRILKRLLGCIRWTEEDLVRLRLIK